MFRNCDLLIDWFIAGLFYPMLCCGCFGRWCLPSCALEHRRFSYYVGFPRKLDLVAVHASFWRGIWICVCRSLVFISWFCDLVDTHSVCFCDIWQQKRVTLLMASALFQGASIGPLIDLAIQIDPRYALFCNHHAFWLYWLWVSVFSAEWSSLFWILVTACDCNLRYIYL